MLQDKPGKDRKVDSFPLPQLYYFKRQAYPAHSILSQLHTKAMFTADRRAKATQLSLSLLITGSFSQLLHFFPCFFFHYFLLIFFFFNICIGLRLLFQSCPTGWLQEVSLSPPQLEAMGFPAPLPHQPHTLFQPLHAQAGAIMRHPHRVTQGSFLKHKTINPSMQFLQSYKE